MKILIRTVMLLSFFAAAAPAVAACECEIMPPAEKLRRAKAVFVGEAVEIGRDERDAWAQTVVKFEVERYWKGVRERFVTVVGAPAAAGACGLPVEAGGKYLIYAFKTGDGRLETSFCVSRRLDRAADELAVIGRGKTRRIKD